MPYMSRFIAHSNSCATTELPILLTSCLSAIKNHGVKCCETVLRGIVKVYFGLSKIQVRLVYL